MIITVVCDVLGEENNGTTIATMNLIRYLKSKGHTVRILCADQSKKNDEGYGKDIFVVPNMDFGKLLNAYVHKIGVTLAKPDVEIIKKALDGADIVHLMIPLALSMSAIKVARENDIPMTAGFHMQAENFTCYVKLNHIKPANKFVYKFIWNHVYKYVDAIHYPTNFIKNVFESNIKKSTNGYVISNGVHDYVQRRETPKPKELEDKFVILSTGRFAREKSQDTLIKALKYSAHKDNIQLILGGMGIKEKKYKKLAKGLPVQPIFKFFQRNEIIDVLNYSDMYVHPAQMELEGIACLEAIACGKLTIVSDSKLSATKEFAVDERCIFKCRNARDLARVIDYWYEHPDERTICEQKYLASAKVYNQRQCMEQMEQMMFDVCKRHKEKSQQKDVSNQK